MARRKLEVFSLSFLDVICCGFGAVILLYTVLSAQSSMIRSRVTEDLSAAVSKLEEEVLVGARNGLVGLVRFVEYGDRGGLDRARAALRKAADREPARHSRRARDEGYLFDYLQGLLDELDASPDHTDGTRSTPALHRGAARAHSTFPLIVPGALACARMASASPE